MQRLPVKTQCFVHSGISCELGKRKKWDERHMQHLPVKTQCFFAVWNKLRIREQKKWDGKHKVYRLALMCSHLLVLQTLLWKHHTLHAADLIPNCARHWLFTSKCLLSVSRPFFF